MNVKVSYQLLSSNRIHQVNRDPAFRRGKLSCLSRGQTRSDEVSFGVYGRDGGLGTNVDFVVRISANRSSQRRTYVAKTRTRSLPNRSSGCFAIQFSRSFSRSPSSSAERDRNPMTEIGSPSGPKSSYEFTAGFRSSDAAAGREVEDYRYFWNHPMPSDILAGLSGT